MQLFFCFIVVICGKNTTFAPDYCKNGIRGDDIQSVGTVAGA